MQLSLQLQHQENKTSKFACHTGDHGVVIVGNKPKRNLNCKRTTDTKRSVHRTLRKALLGEAKDIVHKIELLNNELQL